MWWPKRDKLQCLIDKLIWFACSWSRILMWHLSFWILPWKCFMASNKKRGHTRPLHFRGIRLFISAAQKHSTTCSRSVFFFFNQDNQRCGDKQALPLPILSRCLSLARGTVCSVTAIGTRGTVAVKHPKRQKVLPELELNISDLRQHKPNRDSLYIHVKLSYVPFPPSCVSYLLSSLCPPTWFSF